MSETLKKVVDAVRDETVGEGLNVLTCVIAKVICIFPEDLREGAAEYCFESIRELIRKEQANERKE